jgi:hypothetical protein
VTDVPDSHCQLKLQGSDKIIQTLFGKFQMIDKITFRHHRGGGTYAGWRHSDWFALQKGLDVKKISAKKGPKRKPVKRYTVRIYDEETVRELEELAQSTGYREMSNFFVESSLRSAEGSLSPWELQALEILTFQLGVQIKVVEAALEKLEQDNDAPVQTALVGQAARSKEALDLVQAILGPAASPSKQRRPGRRR